MKKLLALALAVLAAGCAAPPSPTPIAPTRPRLVVLFVFDGLPHRQVADYRDQLAPDGLARFLDRGAWFADAHYGHSFTVTAPGHATLLTGATPSRTGIIGNDWRRHADGELEYCAGDPAHAYIGHETRKLDGTSPRNLEVETLGDVLRGLEPASKVIAISGKDRGAIFNAGRKGAAYTYQAATGRFASTTYYMKEHPPWVTQFNDARPADRYSGQEWKPLLPDDAYGRSLPDGQRWFAPGGRLPKKVAEGAPPGPAYYADLVGTPFFDALMLDFARAAIDGEGLGRDAAPDILSISLSAHDSVNHAYGAESRISHDHVLQVDRMLQEFLGFLDAKVGADRYVAVLTSDHGFMPAPEHSALMGQVAGRMSTSQLVAKLNRSLGAFGQGPFVRYISARGVVIDRSVAASRGVVFDTLADAVRSSLLSEPGIAAAYTRAELESRSRAGEPFFEAMAKSWHRERSGDVEFVLKPHWMVGTGNGTTHGSPHPYDTHVPILFYGTAWVRPGRREQRVDVTDIAPTLAQLLGIPAPPANEGKPLPLR